LYDNPSTHGRDYDIYTLGADGEEGGDGVNADIGNWNLN
ncbi:MAG: type II secretion system protein GspG, partial [Gammaproteobacteria bacterium]